MAANKRTATQRQADLVLIERLHFKRKNMLEIAETINAQRDYSITVQQINYDLRSLKLQWELEHKRERNEAIAETLAEIADLQREYRDAWDRSLDEKIKTRTEKSLPGGETLAGSSKASVEKEQMIGNPAYLTGVMACIERRCKLLGLDAPAKIASTDPSGERSIPIIVVQPGYMDLL